jgi:hypothetical protein
MVRVKHLVIECLFSFFSHSIASSRRKRWTRLFIFVDTEKAKTKTKKKEKS